MLTVSEPVFESVGESIEISPSAFSFTYLAKSAKVIEPLFVISGAEVHDVIDTARIRSSK